MDYCGLFSGCIRGIDWFIFGVLFLLYYRTKS